MIFKRGLFLFGDLGEVKIAIDSKWLMIHVNNIEYIEILRRYNLTYLSFDKQLYSSDTISMFYYDSINSKNIDISYSFKEDGIVNSLYFNNFNIESYSYLKDFEILSNLTLNRLKGYMFKHIPRNLKGGLSILNTHINNLDEMPNIKYTELTISRCEILERNTNEIIVNSLDLGEMLDYDKLNIKSLGDVSLYAQKRKDLKGIQKVINGNLMIHGINFSSLDNFPTKVSGNINITSNNFNITDNELKIEIQKKCVVGGEIIIENWNK